MAKTATSAASPRPQSTSPGTRPRTAPVVPRPAPAAMALDANVTTLSAREIRDVSGLTEQFLRGVSDRWPDAATRTVVTAALEERDLFVAHQGGTGVTQRLTPARWTELLQDQVTKAIEATQSDFADAREYRDRLLKIAARAIEAATHAERYLGAQE